VTLLAVLETLATFPTQSLLHAPTSSTGYLTTVRVLAMEKLGLEVVDVRGMVSLEILSLAGNQLKVRVRESGSDVPFSLGCMVCWLPEWCSTT
jgi:hypothetical protein